MLAVILFLWFNIKVSECQQSCGCIELPGNFSELGFLSTVELIPEVGPKLGTIVPKQDSQFQIIDPQDRSAAVPSLANCSTDCTQLGSDWFTVTDDVCVCGHAASIIHCEEEIGPVVEVFCIEKEKVEVRSSQYERSGDIHWFPTTSDNSDTLPPQRQTDTTVIPENILTGEHVTSTSHDKDHSSPIQALAEHFGVKNESWYLHGYLTNGNQNTTTTEVHYVGDVDSTGANKVLAIILGISALVCLVLAAVRVYVQMRRVRNKAKKSALCAEAASATAMALAAPAAPTATTTNKIVTRL